MDRTPAVAAIGVAILVLSSVGIATADHVPTTATVPGEVPGAALLEEGPVRWLANVQAGNGVAAPLGERGPFERDGRAYIAASSTTFGLHVVDVTEPVSPEVISAYASAFGCPSATAEAYVGGTRDPLAPVAGWENDVSFRPDGTIAVLGMDAAGRCHDPHYGGLEFVDLTDLRNPRTLHLTRNVGEAHSVTIDHERPWLAYISTTDSADFIDVVDFRSCLGGVARIERCDPDTARIPFTEQLPGVPADDPATYGCHDIRVQGDLLYCAAVGQTSIIDISGIVGPDGRLSGTHLDCPTVDATRAPGVKVTDCSMWTEDEFASSGARPANARMLSIIRHRGSQPADRDVAIAHQAEPTADGRIMFVTDERGGGLTNTQGCPGGGIWFYDIRDKSKPVMMRQPDGSPAVFRTPTNLPGDAHMSCTAHYGEQVGEENIMTFAWYLNGTRVFRYTPDFSTSPASVEFEEIAAYLPVGGWTIQAKPMGMNPDNPKELLVYTADENRGIDVLAVRIPELARTGERSGGGGKGNVLGRRAPLPATGLPDPASVALALLVGAALVAQRARRILG